MSRVVFVVILLTITVVSAGWQFVEEGGREEYLPGDCPYYAATAESLLNDGDFDLSNQLAPGRTGEERAAALREHDSNFALSPDGRVVPKHSVLLTILSLPFRAAFGRPGFLVFNGVQVCLLVYSLSLLAGDTRMARLLALVAYAWSPLGFYIYNFSPDILGALLATWVYLAAMRGQWVRCGLLAGLAVWAKVYLAAIVLPAGLLVAAGGWRAVLQALAAGAVGLAPFLILNVHLYGGPLATGYDRTADVQPDGTVRTVTHYTRFNQPILSGLNNILFDWNLGAVPTAPLWALWPVGVWFLWRSGRWRLAAALTGGVAINLLIFARYDEWDASIHGNRFLFPALVLGFAAQGPLWEAVRARLLRGWNGGSRQARDQSTNAKAPGPT
jgi:hypothetical protein